MRSNKTHRVTNSYKNSFKTYTTEENSLFMNESVSSFDTLISPNAKIQLRSQKSLKIQEVLQKFDNFKLLATNRKLLYWTRRLLKDDDTFISFLVVLTIILMLIENEVFYESGNEMSEEIIYLRFIALFLSITTSAWILRRYSMTLNTEILECRFSASDTIFTTGLWKYTLIELAVTCICPYPFLSETFTITQLGFKMEYSWDSVLTIFCMLRFCMISRLFFHYSKYAKVRAEFICSLNGVKVNTSFAIKSQLQESPFSTVCMLFSILSLVCTILVRIVERPDRTDTSDDKTVESGLKLFTDNLWMIIVTSTTVGYGDLYPITHLGRGIVLCACVISSVYIGLLISAIQFQISHTPKQLLVYSLLTQKNKQQELCKNYKQFAGIALLYCIKKNDALLSKGCKKLREICIWKGEIKDAPELDITVARKLIDQTSDLSGVSYRLSRSNLIRCSLEMSKTISIFRDLISKTRNMIDSDLPETVYQNNPKRTVPKYKNTYMETNNFDINSENEEILYLRSSSSEPEEMPKNPRFMR